MTDYNKLLKTYEKPTKSERYSNEYQNKINQEMARKNRHLILDELSLEVPFIVKKSDKKTEGGKNHDFQRTVFRTQAPKVAGRPDNNDFEKTRNIGAKRKQMAAAGRRGV